jgi:hypothetical protein
MICVHLSGQSDLGGEVFLAERLGVVFLAHYHCIIFLHRSLCALMVRDQWKTRVRQSSLTHETLDCLEKGCISTGQGYPRIPAACGMMRIDVKSLLVSRYWRKA